MDSSKSFLMLVRVCSMNANNTHIFIWKSPDTTDRAVLFYKVESRSTLGYAGSLVLE